MDDEQQVADVCAPTVLGNLDDDTPAAIDGKTGELKRGKEFLTFEAVS